MFIKISALFLEYIYFILNVLILVNIGKKIDLIEKEKGKIIKSLANGESLIDIATYLNKT